MQNAAQYFARFSSVRGSLNGLPPFARGIVGIFALPGIALLLLSIVLGLVSISVLLLLTVPVYRLLGAVFGVQRPVAGAPNADNPFVFSLFGQPTGGGDESPGRRQVEAKVTDASAQ